MASYSRFPIKIAIKTKENNIDALQKILSQVDDLIKSNAQMSLDLTIEIALNNEIPTDTTTS